MANNMIKIEYVLALPNEQLQEYQMIEEDFFPPSWKKLGMTKNGLIISK